MSRLAVIGAGNIGSTVGGAWERAGHEVRYGVREPEPPRTLAIAEALAEAEAVLLAVPGGAVPELFTEHGAALAGKLVIDATNRLGTERMHNAEDLEDAAPGARYARAFNTLGWEVLADPNGVEMFWCGPEGDDGELVTRLIVDLGLHPVRVGGLEALDAVDGIGRLWIALVFGAGMPRTIAFKLTGA
jgi:8-hydroxy-5-deazaflavin:NADPH oxidoreductase